MIHLTINRTGSVTMHNHGVNKCASGHHRVFRYHLSIKSPVQLDDQGFLIDHWLLEDTVQRHAKIPESCETICCNVVEAVASLLRTRSLDFKKIYFKFWPEGGSAYMEAELEQ